MPSRRPRLLREKVWEERKERSIKYLLVLMRVFLFLFAGARGDFAAASALKGALQLLINRYGSIRFAHVHERVSTKSFVVLIRGNSNSKSLKRAGGHL